MNTTKVQNEAARDPQIEKSTPSIETIENRQGDIDSSSLAGLMLGMQLRESLSEQDRILLDKLAPSDRSVFLVHRGRFMHPEKFDIFPLEHIGGCAGEQAFFSHRFCPGGEWGGQAVTIQTAVINPGEPNSLLFGWFGPELTSLEGSWDHRFGQLAVDLRRAYSAATALTHRLKAQLKTEVPTLIVDRLTARLLWLNRSAAELCGQKRSALVDLRFEQVRTMLSRALTRRRLVMKRVSTGDIEVTMVTLPEVKASSHPTNRFVADFLVHPSQQKLAGIIMAAELLKSTLSDHDDSEGVELCDIIAGEARELDDLIITEMRSNPRRTLKTQ
jgi:hypothetical protein